MSKIRPKWINAEELIKRWDLGPSGLCQIIKETGIQVYLYCYSYEYEYLFDLWEEGENEHIISLLKSEYLSIGQSDLVDSFEKFDRDSKKDEKQPSVFDLFDKYYPEGASFGPSNNFALFLRFRDSVGEMVKKVDYNNYYKLPSELRGFINLFLAPTLSTPNDLKMDELFFWNNKDFILNNLLFLYADIEGLEKEHDLFESEKEKIPEQDILSDELQKEKAEKAVLAYSEESDPAIKNNEYVFSLIGAYWFIKYKGKITLLQDTNKIKYITHLIDKPNIPQHVMDLYNAVNKQPDSNQVNEKKTYEDGKSLSDLKIDELTADDKDKLEETGYKILQRLMDAKENKNQPAIEQAEKELKFFENHLLNEYGLKTKVTTKAITFFQMDRPGPEIEKARKNVSNQIKSAIKDIEKVLPSLGVHLRTNIDTGTKCTYRLDTSNGIDWYVTF